MSHQDWKEITIGKRANASSSGGMNMKQAKDPKAVAAALRAGMAVQTVKKDSGAGRNALKLELDDENLTHKTVSADVKKAILQGRLAKKLTQAQLAQQINEKPQIVQEYESGKAIPNQQILGKLERILGVKLRGKGVGK
ncbi:Multiprotein bridging factor 1, N-terminal [Ostreococcus tauri]|uniref:Multiprotein bridging factor 1, N-terminal n=1 Tax=Ostreococcus tauri TaxID=70448 RepID=A0A096PAC2_OSTTA|nr:Multiprotein bridging factor 1, N-terminal [Ostreococcus tauri]CEG01869.1 Multiprotein bridging factor 1, N-terminal [Ostreococcus tauri]|eukprot:XP_022841216.1 Multiprotein bridging factor 1, N-terminal [Ostreococcus tauri]